MMSINPEGSLYDDQGVEPFHKHQRPSIGLYQSLKETETKALYPSRLSTPDSIALSTVTSLLTGVDSPLITSQAPTPTRFLRGDVTVEQEMYARGFLEALDGIQGGGNRQPEALAPGTHKLVTSSSGMDLCTMAGPVLGANDLTVASCAHFISRPNHGMVSVAPTYATAPMDFHGIPNLPHPSQSEPSSIYASGPQSYIGNPYTPPIINFPSVMDTTSYSGYSTSAISSHSQPSGMDSSLPPQMVKELRQVVPADIKTQEQMKVERKKARNRIAASKCRVRRLQRESELQGKVRVLKEHNQELNGEVTGLKLQINNLKKALIQHMKGGCRVNLPEGYGLRTDSTSSE